MNFLNPLLLLGALGIALPILAHLLSRFQVQRTDWGAMRFLNRNVRVRSRQIKLRDLLLLILRCMALLLLVLALSRPAWTGNHWLPGERRAGVIIALDVSYSMGHGEEGDTRFTKALKQLDLIRSKMVLGDPVTLMLMGSDQRVLVRNMAYDPNRFDEAIAGLKPGDGKLELSNDLKCVAGLITEMKAPGKEVYLITDAQKVDWSQPSEQLRNALAALREHAQVSVLPVGGSDANLAVTDLELVSGSLRKDTTARYRTTVRNLGATPAANIVVQCRVEGVEIDRKIIPLIAPGAAESVSLFVPFHDAGAIRITAEISGDVLVADNVCRTVAIVRDKISILCVDGSSGDAGRVVTAALTARPDGSSGGDHMVRSIPWLSFPAENLEEQDLIVLTDVPEITSEQAKQLEHFVRKGNGLLWFPGDNIKAAAWNERAASKETPLLPGVIRGKMESSDSLGAGRPLDAGLSDHPVCLPLKSLPEDLLGETRFLRLLDVETSPDSIAVLQLAGGRSPVLIEHSLGRGKVFMFTTTAETTWNNMALTPAFLMVLQQTVTYLSGREFERSRTVGDSLALTYANQPDASDAVFEMPSGTSINVPVREVGGQYVALLKRVPEAGYYNARVSIQSPGLPLAVNVDPRESDVACLAESELRSNLENLGLSVIGINDDLAASIETNRTGRSAWRFLMMATLGFMLIEGLLADRMMYRKRSDDDSNTDPLPQNA
jgi:Aerotolerance regulator N-terminal/von Willebrand factor type A domain/CARDB